MAVAYADVFGTRRAASKCSAVLQFQTTLDAFDSGDELIGVRVLLDDFPIHVRQITPHTGNRQLQVADARLDSRRPWAVAGVQGRRSAQRTIGARNGPKYWTLSGPKGHGNIPKDPRGGDGVR
ncbi:hypothetical protein, partial [Thiohalocapsa halophila]|uniref:hypothetical protein n=1 Tax=Thiohalocapsa halophila TaxID=69359 RepID=UPI001A93A863